MPELGVLAAAWTLPAATVVLVSLAIVEIRRPRRPAGNAGLRWAENIGLYAVLLAIEAWAGPERLSAGVLEGWTGGPFEWVVRHSPAWISLLLGLLVIDALSYALHRMQHLKPFWRFHLVHHADVVVDVTTGFRHHPGEYVVNLLLGSLILGFLGLPIWVVPIYGMLATLYDVWTHSNVALPARLERALSLVLITPGAHHLHHSDDPRHFDTNFGTVLSVWDRLLGTWRPFDGETLRFGVAGHGSQGFFQALLAPVRRPR